MSDAYHLGELRIAQDPDHPAHILPPSAPHGARILDVGCGAGQTLLAAYPDRETFGVDVDLTALMLGRRLAPAVNFVAGRAEQLPFRNEKFDLVVARVSLAYTDIPRSLREIRRVLKPGGKLWMTLHTFAVPWASVKKSNWKGKIFFAYIAINSVYLHLFGREVSFLGRYESFQTEVGMKRALERAQFKEIVADKGRHFVVTAQA